MDGNSSLREVVVLARGVICTSHGSLAGHTSLIGLYNILRNSLTTCALVLIISTYATVHTYVPWPLIGITLNDTMIFWRRH